MATTWYLNADTGNDSAPGDGTSAHPYLTVSKALAVATSGDTVILQASTASYTWANLTFGKSLTLVGANTDASGVILDGGSIETEVAWNVSAGFTLACSKITFYRARPYQYDPGLNFRIEVGSTFTATNCIFRDILVSGNDTGPGGLIGSRYTTSCTVTCTNCLFDNIKLCSSPAYGTAGNIFSGSYSLTLTLTGCTFHFTGTGTDTINNIISSNAQGNHLITIKNCIFNNIGDSMALFYTPTEGTGDVYNYSYNCAYGFTSIPTGTGNITSEPLFVDPANDNFNLRATSPCIDTGTLI